MTDDPDFGHGPFGYLRRRVVILGVFVVSRALLYAAGVRFDGSVIEYAPHFLDLAALRDHYLESLWYLHIQPPLPNALLGALLRLPWDLSTSVAALNLVSTAVMACCVFDVATLVRVPRKGAIAAACVVVLWPSLIVWEQFGAYDYSTAAVATLVVRAAATFVVLRRRSSFAWLLVWSTVLLLSRTLFNPVVYAALIALTLFLARRPEADAAPRSGAPRARRLVALALIPLALWGATAVKNWVVFGEPNVSSWSGINLIRTTLHSLPTDEQLRLAREGKVPDVALQNELAPYSTYAGQMPPCSPAHPDVAVLAEPTKTDAARSPNRNYECLLPVYGMYSNAAKATLRDDPIAYPRVVVGAWQLSFMPQSLSPWTNENRVKLSWYDELSHVPELVVKLPWPSYYPGGGGLVDADGRLELSITVVLLFVAAIVLGARSIVRLRRGSGTAADRAQILVSFAVVVIMLLANTTEIGENYRFRLLVDPLLVVCGAAAIQLLLERRRAGRPSATTAAA